MSWTFRAFMVAYAAAWIVLAVALGFATQVIAKDSSSNGRSILWMTIGTTAVSYAVLAFGYLTGVCSERLRDQIQNGVHCDRDLGLPQFSLGRDLLNQLLFCHSL